MVGGATQGRRAGDRAAWKERKTFFKINLWGVRTDQFI